MSFICPSNRLLPSYVLEWNCMTPELGERWCGLGQVMEQAFTVPLSPHSWRGGDYNSTSPQSSHVRTKQVNWNFYYYFFISVMPLGLWDFSSLTRGWTWDLSSEKLGVLSIGPPENSLNLHLPQFLAHWWRPGGSVVKKKICLPMRESWAQFLGWEDPLEEAWQPTAVFLPEKFPGQKNLAGYNPWGRKESDTTEWLNDSKACCQGFTNITYRYCYCCCWVNFRTLFHDPSPPPHPGPSPRLGSHSPPQGRPLRSFSLSRVRRSLTSSELI